MKKFLLLAAAAFTLTACGNEDNYIDEPVAAQISATITGDLSSRASGTAWTSGDIIGVTMGDRYYNMPYTTTGGDGHFSGTTMYFKNKKDPVTLTAYYPFAGTEGTAPAAISASTGADRQTAAEQAKFDFLFARKEGVVGSDPLVKFEFSHRMSMLTFTFRNGDGIDVSKITSYEVSGLKLDGTFDTATGICAVNSGATAEPITMQTAGTVKNGEALPPLLVFPQSGPVTLMITDSDGQEFSCELSLDNNKNFEIEAGNNYQFKITVNKSGLVIDDPTIAPWNSILVSDENDAW